MVNRLKARDGLDREFSVNYFCAKEVRLWVGKHMKQNVMDVER